MTCTQQWMEQVSRGMLNPRAHLVVQDSQTMVSWMNRRTTPLQIIYEKYPSVGRTKLRRTNVILVRIHLPALQNSSLLVDRWMFYKTNKYFLQYRLQQCVMKC